MHVFPQLRKLEKKYQREMVVIGVHSAKFPAERETANVRQAVLRYRIEHPVVNDSSFQVWQEYACRAWPTIYLIDPRGKVMGRHEGEIPLEGFDRFLATAVQEFDQDGSLDRRPLSFQAEAIEPAALRFPGKVLADEESGRLFTADSVHCRILVANLDGQVQQIIGDGTPGLADGPVARARFNGPQGMALVGGTLYVADTENHAIRRVDLERKEVETIAGTGNQAAMFHTGGRARDVSLNSPWDLVSLDGALYIAMAGFHQLWRMDLDSGRVVPHAGSGREGLQDGPANSALLAQPSGIAANGKALYFADSETSSIRTAEASQGGSVSTIVGQDLFVFGDADGTGDQVRLQHPLGLTYHEGVLYVADSYNHKVKRVFPSLRGCTTFLGTGQAGHRDGNGLSQAQLHEPGGLSIARGKLYIADTNNHAIRVADLVTQEVQTLELLGL